MREWLIVDGYNVINSWTDFAKLRKDNLEHARDLLREKILEYLKATVGCLFLTRRRYRAAPKKKITAR